MITEQNAPIMVQLKESTQKMHDATEAGSFNDDLVKGKLPREKYVESLAQLLLIHRALESHLRRLNVTNPGMGQVLKDHYFQEPYLLHDLTFFGRRIEEIAPLPATAAFISTIEQIAKSQPVGLLGILYVLEGSNNGSKFISRAVTRAYSLANGDGTRYLDPYGDNQKQYWQEFKSDMNRVGFSATESAQLIHAAGQTFEAIMHLHRELQDCQSAPTQKTAPMTSGCPFHRA
jgi:heme oxygenase